MKKIEKYATEAALCADFIAWVKRESGSTHYGRRVPVWTPYAETAGWDILLVAEDGTQIGIQAKLKFNIKVLCQSIPERWAHWHDKGPDYRAVLVPEHDGAHEQLCAALGLGMFSASQLGYYGADNLERNFRPGLGLDDHAEGWHYWSPGKRCDLPEFIPDVVAGASAPVQLTKWKIAALRIVATLEVRGYVTRQDFRSYSIDPRRWTGPGGWVKPGDVPGQFVRGDALDFDKQHPAVYAQVLAEVRKGMHPTEPQSDLLTTA